MTEKTSSTLYYSQRLWDFVICGKCSDVKASGMKCEVEFINWMRFEKEKSLKFLTSLVEQITTELEQEANNEVFVEAQVASFCAFMESLKALRIYYLRDPENRAMTISYAVTSDSGQKFTIVLKYPHDRCETYLSIEIWGSGTGLVNCLDMQQMHKIMDIFRS